MQSTKENSLKEEIIDLQIQSENLRDQIYALECKEAKISDIITQKRKQLQAINQFK